MSCKQPGKYTYKEFEQCSPLHKHDKLGGANISKTQEGKACSPIKCTHEYQRTQIRNIAQGLCTGQHILSKVSKRETSPVLLSRNKFLPCEGEKPPKWPHNTIWQMLASVSMAA